MTSIVVDEAPSPATAIEPEQPEVPEEPSEPSQVVETPLITTEVAAINWCRGSRGHCSSCICFS